MGAIESRDPAVTLGILAGGRGTRLGGVDKAWLELAGQPQVLRLARRFDGEVEHVLVSANTGIGRYARHGLEVVADRIPSAGPLGGLEALASACVTPWLLTVPVDVVAVNDCLLRRLRAAAGVGGAHAWDEDGPQPLVALWNRDRLRTAAAEALAAGELAVHALQARLGIACVRLPGVRFGNLNTPDDLAAHGFQLPAQT
jgi:molybdenum cofactor guanylyltransferase